MQNIPGIAIQKPTEQIPVMKIAPANTGDQNDKFMDLFNTHANLVEDELALTPVSSQEKMLESGPASEDQEATVNAAGNEVPIQDDPEPTEAPLDTRMTEEDFEEIRDDLEAYGMSQEKLDAIEEKIRSDEGMTWGEFTEVVAQSMAEMRTNEFSETEKGKLTSFFSKFGFSDTESDALIRDLENGNQAKVLKALQVKMDAMPKDQRLLFDKQEVEAFTSALGFSKEFTSKLQELFGTNALPKDIKQAFTLIQQEMTALDAKDQTLLQAVTKGFVHAMGDAAKESTLARQVAEAVDLKPRVAEDAFKAETNRDFTQVTDNRQQGLSETHHTKAPAAANQQQPESDTHWTTLLEKVATNDAGTERAQVNVKTDETINTLKTGLTSSTEIGTGTKTHAWEKVSAPKVMKQVDNAFIKTLNNGAKQLTVQLTPENLGKLSIVLQVNGKEVNASIRAENHEAAKIIHENLDIIKNSLENQGLKVEKLDVQTGLANNQDAHEWFGQEQHNMARDREAMAAMRSHMKNMRNGNDGPMAQDLQLLREQAINAAHGLHVIA
ncbi:flagellar hook-length control protein FliK [Pseudodesulfovibrio sp. JC047]|uniref:flagellar hook-length control protein FliK n=1 Tax=Pseudodesulfovibrio sp. JC047 TaxID=2683199 RepID=UPI0013D83817|nr:flagellar hook-length control protein FliK [Pseudodesulfovibrio sp. JC047]NDV20756.1 flagellar hook-length control protein FliK [Pseudodesulfovibrio sp. JC047]